MSHIELELGSDEPPFLQAKRLAHAYNLTHEFVCEAACPGEYFATFSFSGTYDNIIAMLEAYTDGDSEELLDLIADIKS